MFDYIKKLKNTLKSNKNVLRKIRTYRVNNLRILKIKNVKLAGYYFYIWNAYLERIGTYRNFQICIGVPLGMFDLLIISILMQEALQ